MAANIFTGATNNNWGTATNWSLGTVPTATDTHTATFNATSPNCTVNIAAVCNAIDFTGYTNTITMTNSVIVSGNITFDATMSSRVSGSGELVINASCTFIGNGGTWNNNITFSGVGSTCTLTSDLNVSGQVITSQTTIINGAFNINTGGFNSALGVSGTATIVFNGTGTWTGFNAISNPIQINTAGTLTLSGNVNILNNTVTYISGTTITTGSDFRFGSNVTLNVNGDTSPSATTTSSTGINFNTLTVTSNAVFTVSTPIRVIGTFTARGAFNGSTIYCSSNISVTNACSGTSSIVLDGTGTWSGTGTFRNNLTIKSTAIIDIVGNIQFNTGTFIVELGAQVNASNSNLTVAANATTTFDISTIKLNNFYLGGVSTVNTLQLNSPLYITGTAYLGASSQPQTINGSPVYIESGTLSSQAGNGSNILGTSQIIMTGDKATYLDSALPLFNGQGTWRLPITINVRGTILMYGRLVFSTGGTFTILNGTVDHRDGLVNKTSLIIQSSTTLINIHKCKFKTITISANQTLTMNEFFSGSPENKSIIRVTGGATNFKINFTDTAPKKSFFVNIKNCTVQTTPNQLNIIGRDSNSGLNSGIIFGENGMNGFPLNKYGTENSYSFSNGILQGGMNN